MTFTLFGLLIQAAIYTVVISGVSIVIGFSIGMGVLRRDGVVAKGSGYPRPASL